MNIRLHTTDDIAERVFRHQYKSIEEEGELMRIVNTEPANKTYAFSNQQTPLGYIASLQVTHPTGEIQVHTKPKKELEDAYKTALHLYEEIKYTLNKPL